MEFAGRLPSVLFGTLTIPLVFLFAKRVSKDNRVALLATFLTVFLLVEIAWSRQAREYQQFQFFSLLSLYLFYIATQTEKKWYLVPTALATVCTLLSHQFGPTLIVVFLIYTLVTNPWKVRRIFTKGWLFSWRGIVLLLLLGVPLLLLELDLLSSLGVPSISSLQDRLDYSFWGGAYLVYLLRDLPIILLLAIAGAVILRRRDRSAFWLLIIAFVVPLYFVSCHLEGAMADRYIYSLLPIIFVLCALALVRIGATPHHLAGKRIPGVLIAGLLACLILLSSDFVLAPQRMYYDFDRIMQLPDFRTAYDFIDENRSDGDTVIDAWPVVGALYLEAEPDYCLIDNYVIGVGSGRGFERYTGVPYIGTEGLPTVVQENGTGWLAVDTWAWENSLSSEEREFIDQNMALSYEEPPTTGKKGEMLVYRWGT
jgi:hypothetical protein